MFYLIITVLLNVIITVIFRLFPKYHINQLQAIVTNYWVCVLTGILYYGDNNALYHLTQKSWWLWPVILGISFISIFNLMAFVTVKNGIAVASVANKISLIIPVVVSLFIYNESLGWYKFLGIFIAIPAVYLSVQAQEKNNKLSATMLAWWPLLLFVGSGLLDSLMQYVQHHFINGDDETKLLPVGIFFTAATIGSCILLYQRFAKASKIEMKNIVAGIVLGIPNYASIYYLIKLLQSKIFESSTIFGILNISIVILSVLVATLFFKERITLKRALGIALALVSIILIALSTQQ